MGRTVDDFSFSTLGGAVLMPGETMHAVSVPRGALADSLSIAAADLRVDICYCSAYEDCWWLTDPHLGAARSHQALRPTEACSAPDERRFVM